MSFSTTSDAKKSSSLHSILPSSLFSGYIKILVLFFSLSACVTRLPTPSGIKEISLSNYENLVETKTQTVRVYNGFSNQLEIYATQMDADMNDGYLSHAGRLFQWSVSTYNDEKDKVILKQGTQSEFMVSFFTPERKNDDLSSSKSAWKIYLDVDGIRYEGKATKVKRNLAELEAFFPHHNRWFTLYSVTFPIATSLSESKASVLTFTSGLGSTQLRF